MAPGAASRLGSGRRRTGRPARAEMTRVALAGFALASVALSLTLRVVHRGPYYPGWDALGAAQGMLLVATRTPQQIARWYLDHRYDLGAAWNTYGVPHVLLP